LRRLYKPTHLITLQLTYLVPHKGVINSLCARHVDEKCPQNFCGFLAFFLGGATVRVLNSNPDPTYVKKSLSKLPRLALKRARTSA
jgi:hypothetical protein